MWKIAPGGRSWRGVTGIAAAAVAATGTLSLAVPAMAAPASGRAAAASRMPGAGQTGSLASVPWSRVGPGWTLAMFSRDAGAEGKLIKYGPSTLYLVSPRGGRYALKTWPARSAASHWLLRSWSGDTLRALFTSAGASDTVQVHQLQLRTGRISSFTLPANRAVVGYTRPDGLNILVAKWAPSFTRGTLQRYSLTGRLLTALATVDNPEESAYQPAGEALATVEKNGLVLVGNRGGIIRKLPVPGTRYGCNPVRWWSAGTILASCMGPIKEPWQRLWLVPASGARPTAQRAGGTFDLGDLNAWQLKSGLYLDAAQGCGAGTIARQPARGPEQQVQVPGAAGEVIVNATRTQLEVERFGGCVSGTSLVWFNPVTRAVTVALGTSGAEFGVEGAIPYFVTGKF